MYPNIFPFQFTRHGSACISSIGETKNSVNVNKLRRREHDSFSKDIHYLYHDCGDFLDDFKYRQEEIVDNQ